jgi:YkoY family integral membrane protein
MHIVPPLAAWDWFGQQFEWNDTIVIGLLILLEGVLSIDNALVLGLLAKRLPKHQQRRALTYGLVGAFAFRLVAIATASFLLRWRIAKLLGGGYLLYVAIRHLFFESKEEVEETLTVDAEGQPTLVNAVTGEPLDEEQTELEIDERVPIDLAARSESVAGKASFWPTVAVIELTDIAFALDSILAAIALVGSPPPGHAADALHPKLWLVVVGGMLGVVLMRFAAVMFIKLLERFPRFEVSAYLLVIVIGGKLLVDYFFNSPLHPHRVDFHNWNHPAFWVFWVLMLISFAIGFIPRVASGTPASKRLP